MRSEKEMYDLILGTAMEDERIRAVYMGGSRTNTNVPKDIFQDYDVVYVVYDTAPFIEDRAWINRFGKRLFMQYPEEGKVHPADPENCYGWLIQFADGNRMDLHVVLPNRAREEIASDRLCKILLDKDGVYNDVLPSSDETHWVQRPSEDVFLSVCNEFWWCLDNVVKGVWRNEVTYAMDMINMWVRPQLMKFLSWEVGVKSRFGVSVGKSGKYLPQWLDKADWDQYLSTYSDANVDNIWDSIDKMCVLFTKKERYLAEQFGFGYNEEELINAYKYVKHVRYLPQDAKEVYEG